MKNEDILKLKFKSNDLNKKVTVAEFFCELLTALWNDGESFSGKRPLGNSGWDHDLIACLVKNGIVTGSFEYGNSESYLHDYDQKQADKVVLSLIKSLAS